MAALLMRVASDDTASHQPSDTLVTHPHAAPGGALLSTQPSGLSLQPSKVLISSPSSLPNSVLGCSLMHASRRTPTQSSSARMGS